MMVSVSLSRTHNFLGAGGSVSTQRASRVAAGGMSLKMPRGGAATSVGANPENVSSRESKLRLECQTPPEENISNGGRARSSSRGSLFCVVGRILRCGPDPQRQLEFAAMFAIGARPFLPVAHFDSDHRMHILCRLAAHLWMESTILLGDAIALSRFRNTRPN